MSEKVKISWSLCGTLFSSIVQISQVLILTRFIAPEDFGVFAVCSIFIGLGLLFSQGGIGNAIIQNKSLNNNELNSIYWFNIIVSTGVLILISLPSEIIANFYEMPKLIYIIPVVAITIPFQSIGRFYQAILQNHFNLSSIAKADIYSRTLGFIAAIIVASNDGGVESLIYANIAWSVSRCLFLHLSCAKYFKIKMKLEYSHIKKISKFSFYQLVELLFSFVTRNLDITLLAKLLDKETSGYYAILRNLLLNVEILYFRLFLDTFILNYRPFKKIRLN